MSTEEPRQPRPASESIPEIISRLGQDVMTFLEARIRLLKLEIAEDLGVLAKRALRTALGTAVAGAGVLLVGVSFGFAVSELMPDRLDQAVRYALGFAIVGAAAVLTGAVVAWTGYRAMRTTSIWPEQSVKENRLDQQLARKVLP